MLYDKSFAQRKKDPFHLHKAEFKVVCARIKAYGHYVEILKEIESKSPADLTKKDIEDKVTVESYIKCIHDGLNWIPAEARAPIWEKVVKDTKWYILAAKYHYSESWLRGYYQVYIYGVGTELGENFDK